MMIVNFTGPSRELSSRKVPLWCVPYLWLLLSDSIDLLTEAGHVIHLIGFQGF